MHGPLTCNKCFGVCASREMEIDGWRLVNDPGHWGAADPIVLVLGQSKGSTQAKTYAAGEFDQAAFAGIRERLANVLARIGLLPAADKIDRRFAEAEKDFAFASLLRCSLTDSSGKSSGSPVAAAMRHPAADSWIRACMETWLTHPNPRLRVVVLLGLTSTYVKNVKKRLRILHATTYRDKNAVAAEAAGITWLFVQHPSKICENHYRAWIGQEPHAKRDMATKVVAGVFIPPIGQLPSTG